MDDGVIPCLYSTLELMGMRDASSSEAYKKMINDEIDRRNSKVVIEKVVTYQLNVDGHVFLMTREDLVNLKNSITASLGMS